MEDPLVGEIIGGCRLERLLGRGGMGAVYRAVRLADQADVAVKLLEPRLEADPEYVERFLRESRAAASVDHPNVVQLLDVGEEQGQHYLTLEFIDGETLEALLGRERRLPGRRAAAITSAIASGLGALHGCGVVHRDIKPANILLGRDGSVRITDFGLARELRVQGRLTAPGVFMGTPEYVAPEQVKGVAIDARTDLYSLGICFYRMLSGELPFQAMNAMQMATLQVKGTPRPLAWKAKDADPQAVAIVERLLQKDPAKRFPSAAELVRALAPLVGSGPAPAPGFRPPRTVAPKSPAPSKPPVPSLPHRLRRGGPSWPFWPLLVVSGALAFLAGGTALEPGPWSALRGGEGWALRAGFLGAALLGWGGALRAGRGVRSALRPGLWIPSAALLGLYAAGVSAPRPLGSSPVFLRAAEGMASSLGRPVWLGPLGIWLACAGLAWGRAAGGSLVRVAAGGMVLSGLACLWGFAQRGDLATALRMTLTWRQLPSITALAAAALGTALAFAAARIWIQRIGCLMVALSACTILFRSPGWKGSVAWNPFEGAVDQFGPHGLWALAALVLVSLSAWFLHAREGEDL